MEEIIYVLINEAMPGFTKIGRTTNLEQRIRSLDTTSVPLPFECFYACTVKDSLFVEKQLHDAFLDHRVRSSREFFEVAPERVVSALKLVALADVTPKKDFVETQEDQRALDEARSRRSAFNFKLAGIPVGAELSFIHNQELKAKVVDNKNVELNGVTMSLSSAAKSLLGVNYGVAGTLYWLFEGESLDERRRRLEEQD